MNVLDTLRAGLRDESAAELRLSRQQALELLTLCEQGAAAEAPVWYRHYKGGLYQLLLSATFEADHTPLVVYRAGNGTVWARTRDNFHESVSVDGVLTPRFARVSGSNPV